MGDEIEVLGTNPNAAFTLKVHRGDGMALLGMDWRDPTPPADLVGFSVEYRPPNHTKFLALGNRITFATPPSNVGPNPKSSLFAPIQNRWVPFLRSRAARRVPLSGPARVHVRVAGDHLG